MDDDEGELLRLYGESAGVWASRGRHETGDQWWVALSGEASVNFNLTCSWAPDASSTLTHCVAPILDAKVPGMVMLSGPGLSSAQALVDAGWVCVRALPFMALSSLPASTATFDDARELTVDELPLAREVFGDAFGWSPSTLAAGLTDDFAFRADAHAWGLFEGVTMVGALSAVTVKGRVVIWSMATRRERQGHGVGRRLVDAVLAHEAKVGATGAVLHSSRAGEKLYHDVGYRVLSYLQLWSRPRWVLGSS